MRANGLLGARSFTRRFSPSRPHLFSLHYRLQPDFQFKVVKAIAPGQELLWCYIPNQGYAEGDFTALSYALLAAKAADLAPSRYLV